jgi:hypothetical protein
MAAGAFGVLDYPASATPTPAGRHLGPFDESTSTRADYVGMLERADQGIGWILGARQAWRADTHLLTLTPKGRVAMVRYQTDRIAKPGVVSAPNSCPHSSSCALVSPDRRVAPWSKLLSSADE